MAAAAPEARGVSETAAVNAADRHRAWEWAALGLILGVAAVLRFHHIGARSFWIDELYSLESIITGNAAAHADVPWDTVTPAAPPITHPNSLVPWWRLLAPDRHDIHPPLYTVLLRGWAGGAFGFAEAGVRSLSAVASLAAIALLFEIVRLLSGRTAALWAALLMALAQPQIAFGQEARSYALVLALALAAALAAVRIEKRGATTGRRIALGVALFAMLVTHYFALAAVLAITAYLALRLRPPERRRAMTACLLALGAFALLCGPFIIAQRRGIAGRGTTVFVDSGPGHLRRTALRLLMLPARYLSEPLPSTAPLASATALIAVVPFGLLRRRADLLLWALWLPMCVAPAVLVDLTAGSDSIERLRYTVLASPAVYALIAALLVTARPLLRHATPAAAALGCAAAIPNPHDPFAHHHPDWRRVGRGISAIARPGDVTVFAGAADDGEGTRQLFVCAGHYAYPLPGPVVLLFGPETDASLRERLRRAPGVILVTDLRDPESILPGARATALRIFQDAYTEVYRLEPGRGDGGGDGASSTPSPLSPPPAAPVTSD